VVGTSIVCRVDASSITTALESFVTPPTPGDTIWLFSQDTLGSSWLPLALTAVWTQPSHAPSDCGGHTFPASAYAARAGARAGYALSLSEPVPRSVGPGTPIRVTRLVHYSLYRAPDARWYLGRREWSPARGRFEVIQPVSGPYRPYGLEATQTSGLELRYLDESGESVPSGNSATERVASMVVTIRAPPPRSDASRSERRDALSVSVALRNRR
jgi:hypothetical protein